MTRASTEPKCRPSAVVKSPAGEISSTPRLFCLTGTLGSSKPKILWLSQRHAPRSAGQIAAQLGIEPVRERDRHHEVGLTVADFKVRRAARRQYFR